MVFLVLVVAGAVVLVTRILKAPDRGATLGGVSAVGLVITGYLGFVLTLLATARGEAVAGALFLAAVALAFGLLANAVHRR